MAIIEFSLHIDGATINCESNGLNYRWDHDRELAAKQFKDLDFIIGDWAYYFSTFQKAI